MVNLNKCNNYSLSCCLSSYVQFSYLASSVQASNTASFSLNEVTMTRLLTTMSAISELNFMLWTYEKSMKLYHTRQASSMIPSARPTAPPVANIIFMRRFCFLLRVFVKWRRTNVQTDYGRTTRVKKFITTGNNSGSDKWIKNCTFGPVNMSGLPAHHF